MLRVAKDDGGDADQAGFPDRFAQESVSMFATLGGHQIVGALEKAIVDFFWS